MQKNLKKLGKAFPPTFTEIELFDTEISDIILSAIDDLLWPLPESSPKWELSPHCKVNLTREVLY